MSKQPLEKYTEFPQHKCHNCEHDYEGFFCSRCGQRYYEGRYTFKESSHWFVDKVLNVERGLFYTIKMLLLKPGKVVSEYLNRATVRYMHPFRFVFLLATISALLTILTGTFDSPEMIKVLEDMGHEDEEKLRNTQRVLEQVKKYLTLILMLSIPVNSLASFLVYKRKKYNFTEHLILNSFSYGLSLFLSFPLFLLLLLPNGFYLNSIFGMPVYVLAFAWVYSRFFKENFFIGILKAIVVTILGVILAMILGAIISILGMIVYVYIFK